MEERKVVVNGKALTEAEATSLRAALDLAIMDLNTLPPDRQIDGIPVAEHLDNLKEFLKLIHTQ